MAEFAPEEEPTAEPAAENTRAPENTSVPTNTAIPEPTADPNLINPGTFLVNTELQPGLYVGQTGTDIFDSCYWERLSDLSGSFEAILANDNGIGKYYLEVKNEDFALKTDCAITYLPTLPAPALEFPTNIGTGIYLVGIDILPGTYQGQAGTEITDSCYWVRLNNVAGGFDAIIANDNGTGQYYAQVQASDFAFQTACDMERVGD